MDDPLYKYQCLECPQEFFGTGTKPYHCHLKPTVAEIHDVVDAFNVPAHWRVDCLAANVFAGTLLEITGSQSKMIITGRASGPFRNCKCYKLMGARYAKLTHELNNQLAGTWLFHQWLDGLHTFADDDQYNDNNIPILVLHPVKESIQSVYLPGLPPTTPGGSQVPMIH